MKSIRKSPVMMCLDADASAERRVGKGGNLAWPECLWSRLGALWASQDPCSAPGGEHGCAGPLAGAGDRGL